MLRYKRHASSALSSVFLFLSQRQREKVAQPDEDTDLRLPFRSYCKLVNHRMHPAPTQHDKRGIAVSCREETEESNYGMLMLQTLPGEPSFSHRFTEKVVCFVDQLVGSEQGSTGTKADASHKRMCVRAAHVYISQALI